MSDTATKNINGDRYNVFIDLDNTLLDINSGTVLAIKAHRKGLMRTSDLLNGLYLSILYKLEWRDTRIIINRMAMWMKGIEEGVFTQFASHVAERFLIPRVRPEMKRAIHEHKARGARIVMLSAALNYICDPIAESLGFDEVLCSYLEIEDGVFTGKPQGKLNFGEEKLVRLMKFYEQYPGNPNKDYYYADNISDVYVMKHVGNPVAVEPDRHLRRHAKRRNWHIIK